MSIFGTVHKGVIIPDESVGLAEGMRVEINLDSSKPDLRRGSIEAIRKLKLRWAGEPGELDRLLAELKLEKQGDLDLEKTQPELER